MTQSSLKEKKKERLDQANQIISQISQYGRRFFYCKSRHRTASFVIDDLGHLRFIDDYTGEEVLIVKNGKWRGFSHGGTLRALIEALALYVRDGTPVRSGHFGPFPDYLCNGDLWGYGKDEMARLRKALSTNPAISWPQKDIAA